MNDDPFEIPELNLNGAVLSEANMVYMLCQNGPDPDEVLFLSRGQRVGRIFNIGPGVE